MYRNKISIDNIYIYIIMPQKLNQCLKELEKFKDKALSMHGLKINSNTLQSFMDMEKEMIKEINKGKNRGKKEENNSKLI
jgi:hypothetical protein